MQLPPVVMFQVQCQEVRCCLDALAALACREDWSLAPAPVLLIAVIAVIVAVVISFLAVVAIPVVIYSLPVPAQALDFSHMSARIQHGSGRT